MRTLIAAMLVLLVTTGCVTHYPVAETKLPFTYPLADCNPAALAAAQAQVLKPAGQQQLSQASVCVTRLLAPATAQVLSVDDKVRLEAQALSLAESELRTALETPFFPADRARSHFGIALSGGGTKASSFSIGVLAGLADAGLLDKADYISTVSGGGYAAYFYYAHRIFPALRSGPRTPVSNQDLFRDCLSDPEGFAEEPIGARIRSTNYCGRLDLASRADTAAQRAQDIRYQALLKCSQDLLRPGCCHMTTTAGMDSGISLHALLGTVGSIPHANVASTAFDRGYFLSPSGHAYRHGIGLAYGATLTRSTPLSEVAITDAARRCGQSSPGLMAMLDCQPDGPGHGPAPIALTFDELRLGLLKRGPAGARLPFWIMSAAAPQTRSVFGWMTTGKDDVTNSDMFEMTAVSHGSGRYGYVSASPAIHDLSVLDSVAASAAFLDANQLKYKNRYLRTLLGVGQHVANLDWGYDIANYNLGVERRQLHRRLPFPLYWFDKRMVDAPAIEHPSPELKDRHRSVFIRLIDGGNAENLGAYSLLKRDVKHLLISDAAADENGLFKDICDLGRRLRYTPGDVLPKNLYLPGLEDFAGHCGKVDDKDFAYDMQSWFAHHPVLFGCIRHQAVASGSDACKELGEKDVRLFIAKPAINFRHFIANQMNGRIGGKLAECYVRGVDTLAPTSLLNCDSAIFLKLNHGVEKGVSPGCPIFPQHSTLLMTANSSGTLFVAYRELARQYVAQTAAILAKLIAGDATGARDFDSVIADQAKKPLPANGTKCE
ncbi:patatin-like phospholipase family protein [Massilia sp. DJPM01]|uniref:patatin-like phospholipase family protein n=1 Tax=Massilia sp. DJPM01 TaxID=3024404 RepID=UPI00259FC1CC|nr:patatin-like phospholipase family protein [Massilia sp. DJPM01]MDM5180808.1 patatin-like phospholipase family protein [Massilia sp. DJPM01]